MEKANAAPTGCYKCGRPGHWSRDCPDSNPNPNSTHLTNSRSFPFNQPNGNSNNNNSSSSSKVVAEKPKKVPRSRPKLTPELLLGDDDGLGFVLRHFPRNFKPRGRGHEVSDLGKLIGLYSEWHSRLLPYHSFDQFVHKVEKIGSTKRVKMCIRDLRERVARGGDPTKLCESPTEHVDPNLEQDISTPVGATNSEQLHHDGDPFSKNHDADVIQEDLLHVIYDRATKEPSKTSQSDVVLPNHNNGVSRSTEVLVTEEQKARMEANRLKALERAAARGRSIQST